MKTSIKNNNIIMILDGYLILTGLFCAYTYPYQLGDLILFDLGLLIMLGAFSSNIMLKKDRSGRLGWILGFFLPLIGLIICVLIPKKGGGLGKDEMLCPWCKEVIKAGAVICKHCGKDPRVLPSEPERKNP